MVHSKVKADCVPLLALPAFAEFQAGLENWIAEPPDPERLTVVGSYRFFD
jgi:hypothetical protein